MSNALMVQIDAAPTVDKFKKMFMAVHKVDEQSATQMFEVEKFSFLKEVNERGLIDVTPISAMGVFLDITSNGLSFGSSAKHVYLMTRNVKNAAGGYEKRLVYSTSPDGKIYQAQRSGAIDYVTKPVLIYEGDDFGISTNEHGEQIIRHTIKFPRASQKIIAGYVYTVYKGGKREPFWMDVNDIERLKGYSAKNNGRSGQPGTANALYTSNSGQIDTGFFSSKLISFALKNVRKSALPSQYEVQGEVADTLAAGVTIQELPEASGEFTPVMTVEPVVSSGPVTIMPTEQYPADLQETAPATQTQSIANPNAPF